MDTSHSLSTRDAHASRDAMLPAMTDGSTFLAAVQRMPILSREDELQLSRRLRDDQDRRATQQLVLANLRHVVSIARGYFGYGLPLPDLIQEGSIGLMKAVKRYDPEAGVRLMSFAVHWIHAEIREYVVRNWRMVRIATTKPQRKLFFKLRGLKKDTGWIGRQEARDIAGQLRVPVKAVLQMDGRLNAPDRTLDAPLHDGEGPTLADRLPADSDPARELMDVDAGRYAVAKLRKALPNLDARSRDILQRRWLVEDRPASLSDLGRRHRVSAERVRQIQNHALEQLRESMDSVAA